MRTQVAYIGATPGADTDDYVIFDSTVSMPNGGLTIGDTKRVLISISHNADGTLKEYKSSDGGTTWIQIAADDAITAVSNVDTFKEYQVQPYVDYKVEWTNGNSAQTTWNVSVALDTESF